VNLFLVPSYEVYVLYNICFCVLVINCRMYNQWLSGEKRWLSGQRIQPWIRWRGLDSKFGHHFVFQSRQIRIMSLDKGGPLLEYRIYGANHGPSWKHDIGWVMHQCNAHLNKTTLPYALITVKPTNVDKQGICQEQRITGQTLPQTGNHLELESEEGQK